MARANDDAVSAYLAQFDDDIVNRARVAIVEALPQGVPAQAQIARVLHMSARSLQRRLTEQGETFTALREALRQELAQQYLRDGERPISEIAYLLGFTEPTNFTRSFRRWTGRSPSEFRDEA